MAIVVRVNLVEHGFHLLALVLVLLLATDHSKEFIESDHAIIVGVHLAPVLSGLLLDVPSQLC